MLSKFLLRNKRYNSKSNFSQLTETILILIPYRKAFKRLYTDTFSEWRNVLFTTILLLSLFVTFMQESPYGSEKLGSIIQKNNHTTYSYVILHTATNSYSAITEMSFDYPEYIVENLYFPNSKKIYINDCTFTIFDYYKAYHMLKIPLYIPEKDVESLEYLNIKPNEDALKGHKVPIN